MKFKALLAVGILATIGATLWMREIASWRPHVVARLSITQGYMVLSRDGRRMLVRGFGKNIMSGSKTVVLDLASESIDSNPQPMRRFWKANAVEPHLSLNKSQTQLVFSPAPGKTVLLAGKIHPQDFDFDASGQGASHFAWSKARGEIYRENNGELRIWDSQTGRLKNRHSHWKDGSYQTGLFSPDGQSLLSSHRTFKGIYTLIRYDVPSGKATAMIYRAILPVNLWGGGYGWSPDGKFLWFVRKNPSSDSSFNVLRAADSKLVWSAPCAGPSKWLPDGRIGLMQQGGFSWRDASGHETGHASGPLPGKIAAFGGAPDWQASPDGRWIYDLDESHGIIRRWRAK